MTSPRLHAHACTQGQNPSRNNPHFWEELLLLKVNAVFLETLVTQTSEEQLLALKVSPSLSLSRLCVWCVS
jgi:hypothetical protein